ncbi:Ger(x)C family spore germination protein [Sporosarcina siberiensis]|uniref:Ger(X)C family spore germination protein n=1 Tax=Sporosarcina siberiensis TaxID=1365606 RepID=A0ABW4SKC2_9BACL
MKGIKVSMLFLFSLLLVSCIQTQEIEKLAVINVLGIDHFEEDQIELTVAVFQFSAQSEEITKLMYGKGKTIKGAADDVESSSTFRLAPGKTRLSIFGKEMAEIGILPLLDTAVRDARLPDLMYLSVSKATAKEIISTGAEELTVDVGELLHGIIKNHSTNHNVPRRTVHDFLRIYHDIGHDNVLPLFEIQDNNPKLTAIAVFKGDEFVGEMTLQEALLLNLMDKTVKGENLDLSLPIEPFENHLEKREDRDQNKEVEISVLINKGKSKTKLVDFENQIFQTNTNMEVRLLEQSAGINLESPHVLKQIEKEIEKIMKSRFEKLLNKLQKLNADTFGYGRYYKSHEKGKDLTKDEWREKYPEIDVQFNVSIKILRHGVKD